MSNARSRSEMRKPREGMRMQDYESIPVDLPFASETQWTLSKAWQSTRHGEERVP